MLVRRAIAILAVLRAHSMAVLRDLPRDPLRLRQRSNQVTHQLRLPNATRMAADDNHPPPIQIVTHSIPIKTLPPLSSFSALFRFSWRCCYSVLLCNVVLSDFLFLPDSRCSCYSYLKPFPSL